MTPSEIKAVFELMREFRVHHFKQGDFEASLDLPVEAMKLTPVDEKDAKYWSAPEAPNLE